MFKQLLAFKNAYLNREDGVTAIEYALIAAAVAGVLVGATALFTDDLSGTFGTISDRLSTAEENTG